MEQQPKDVHKPIVMFLMDEKCSYGCCVLQLRTLFYVKEQYYTYVVNDVGSVGGLR